MTKTLAISPVLFASALALGGCSSNYAGEGALAGAAVGAGVGALRGGDVAESAAIGAGVGAVGGALIEKDGKCYRRDDRGREYEVRCRDYRR
ncbi:MAG TPA: YMGG-like glycine zipper-containing protein [Devosia sp.]|nr:YMGG-like glycine zipper-containing protein [Sphingomonadaceae bacterium]HTO29151.1 YMGG-like glycine zipper-containing protein [Devosia sp.]